MFQIFNFKWLKIKRFRRTEEALEKKEMNDKTVFLRLISFENVKNVKHLSRSRILILLTSASSTCKPHRIARNIGQGLLRAVDR